MAVHDQQLSCENTRSKNSFEGIESVRAFLDPQLILLDDWTLLVPRLDARVDEPESKVLDISSIWLPPNDVYPVGQALSKFPRLAAVLVLAVSDYWVRARTQKSRHSRCVALAANLAKFIEYSWLNNRFNLLDWRPADFEILAQLLSTGGWQHALRVGERVAIFCKSSTPSTLSKILISESGRKQKSINSKRFSAAISTNVQGQEAKVYYGPIAEIAGSDLRSAALGDLIKKSLETVVPKKPSSSMLRQIFEAINYTYNLPHALGTSSLPFPSAHYLSLRLGKRSGRTANLGADDASKLFAESFKWLYRYGPKVEEIISALCESVIGAHRSGREVMGYDFENLLVNLPQVKWLSEQISVEVNWVDMGPQGSDTMSVRECLLCVFSACFFLVASMNARRKDEVSHRRFGLHRGCVKVVDPFLKLYVAEFYIEKTFMDYMSFYVNQTTNDVVQLLDKIQTNFDRVDAELGRRNLSETPVREQTLFSYRRFNRLAGINEERCWYGFETRSGGAAQRFLKFALRGTEEIDVTPHMFRRAYALIFFYRYRNGNLIALSSQLRHEDLSSTMTYVTDPYFISDAEGIQEEFRTLSEGARIAFNAEISGIQQELKEVGDEVMMENILQIISGLPLIGGYQKFIRFVYARIGKNIDFKNRDLSGRAEGVARIVKARGHSVYPMKHGDCMAGTTTSVHLAHCRSKDGEALQRHKAGPTTCAKCPFHHSSEVFLIHLREDLSHLREVSLSGAHLEASVALKSAENLASLIELHEQRLITGMGERNE